MKVLVKCKVCGKEEYVYEKRSITYKTCSFKCLGEYYKGVNNVSCTICGKKFHVKPYRNKRLNNSLGITCSKECNKKLKSILYMGRNNPNTKYNINDNFFETVDTEEKAYLLGWIASDGSVNKGAISIYIDKNDIECLTKIKNIISNELPIKTKKTLVGFSISSMKIVKDVCNLLSIEPKKKSDVVKFPNLDNDDLKWAFVRGYFDGDGHIVKISENHSNPSCCITSNSTTMLQSIKDFCNIPSTLDVDNLHWHSNNALDFLSKIYDNSSIKLRRKYDQYLDISTWVPSVSYSRYYKNEHCSWSKTRKDAISPSKQRASDSGYDLVLLEKIKTVGKVEFYDTGIKVKPKFGYYFTLVPRSSISKTGYMLANSIGIIDRTYLGDIIVALTKIDENAPDLELPCRLVQIIPNHIVHFEFEEVESFDLNETERGEKGFGSSGKK